MVLNECEMLRNIESPTELKYNEYGEEYIGKFNAPTIDSRGEVEQRLTCLKKDQGKSC